MLDRDDESSDIVAMFPSHRASFNSREAEYAYLNDSLLVSAICAWRDCGESEARVLLRAAVENAGGGWGQRTYRGGLRTGHPTTHVFEVYWVPWSVVE